MPLENTTAGQRHIQTLLGYSLSFQQLLRLFLNQMWYLCKNKPKCIFLPLLFSVPFWTLIPSYCTVSQNWILLVMMYCFTPADFICWCPIPVAQTDPQLQKKTPVFSWTQKDSNKKTRKGSWGDKNAHPHSEETGNSSLSRHLTWLQELLQRNEPKFTTN